MVPIPGKIKAVIAGMVVTAFLLPIVIYYFAIGSVPALTVQEARATLTSMGNEWTLVDIRTSEEFAYEHLNVAINWPYESLMSISSREDLPDHIVGKKLPLR